MPTPATVLLHRLLARARLRHLQVLVAVAELGSLRRAAQAVGLTQPAVTHVVADLESLLGAPLFERHARGVTPTAIALELLPVARRALAAIAEGSEAVAARLAQADGVIRLASTVSGLSGLLDRLLPAFSAAEPGVQVLLGQAEADQFNGLVARGEVDAVACRRPAVLPSGWVFEPLLDDEMVVVCGPAHPLARRKAVRVNALADETWLVAPADSLARRALDALAAERGWQPRLSPVVTRALPMTWALLQQQRVVAMVPLAVVRQLCDARQLVALPLDQRWPIDALGLLLPPEGPGDGRNPAVARLLAFAARQRGAGAPRGLTSRSPAT
ncbi:LysR family transcriptional regulator [Ideonella sp. DXS22W]|uniref:LysR family transcriptional regulator n=1 Tax=Pseudaquabacterium inlustre TaxID=2984192 RepID=A0ABU9CGP3_9BURK